MNTTKARKRKRAAAVAWTDLLVRVRDEAEAEMARWQGYAQNLENHGQEATHARLRQAMARTVADIFMRANQQLRDSLAKKLVTTTAPDAWMIGKL